MKANEKALVQAVSAMFDNGTKATHDYDNAMQALQRNADITVKLVVMASDWDILRDAFKTLYESRMLANGTWQRLELPDGMNPDGSIKPKLTDAQKAAVAGYRNVRNEHNRTACRMFARWVVTPTRKAYPNLPKPTTTAKGTKTVNAEREAFVAQRDMLNDWTGRDVDTEIRYERMAFLTKCIKNEKKVAEFLATMRGTMRKAA